MFKIEFFFSLQSFSISHIDRTIETRSFKEQGSLLNHNKLKGHFFTMAKSQIYKINERFTKVIYISVWNTQYVFNRKH